MPYNVTLNVYDLPEQESVNNNLRSLGLGFYHTGVQFHNHEYSFSDQGVAQTRPLLPEFGTVRESLPMPSYAGTLESFLALVEELQQTSFRPGRYHLLHRNCNHFSDALLQAVCGGDARARVPDWVNRAAHAGSGFSLGTAAGEGGEGGEGTPSSSRGAEGGACHFPAPGRVKPPSLPISSGEESGSNESAATATATASASSSFSGSVFNWFFGSSSASSGGNEKTAARIEPNKKKELTEKQKQMLSKLKSSNK